MITSFQIYLMSIADNIRETSITIFVSSLSAMIISIIGYITTIGDDEKVISKIFKKLGIISFLFFIISSLMMMLTPNTKSLIAIYTIPPIVNNKEVQKLPENLVKFANDYLEKASKEERK